MHIVLALMTLAAADPATADDGAWGQAPESTSCGVLVNPGGAVVSDGDVAAHAPTVWGLGVCAASSVAGIVGSLGWAAVVLGGSLCGGSFLLFSPWGIALVLGAVGLGPLLAGIAGPGAVTATMAWGPFGEDRRWSLVGAAVPGLVFGALAGLAAVVLPMVLIAALATSNLGLLPIALGSYGVLGALFGMAAFGLAAVLSPSISVLGVASHITAVRAGLVSVLDVPAPASPAAAQAY